MLNTYYGGFLGGFFAQILRSEDSRPRGFFVKFWDLSPRHSFHDLLLCPISSGREISRLPTKVTSERRFCRPLARFFFTSAAEPMGAGPFQTANRLKWIEDPRRKPTACVAILVPTMGRYRNPKEVRVVVNYAEAAEWYGFPLPFEPIYPRNRKPGQKYLPRSSAGLMMSQGRSPPRPLRSSRRNLWP
jgi:hypothetical protein